MLWIVVLAGLKKDMEMESKIYLGSLFAFKIFTCFHVIFEQPQSFYNKAQLALSYVGRISKALPANPHVFLFDHHHTFCEQSIA